MPNSFLKPPLLHRKSVCTNWRNSQSGRYFPVNEQSERRAFYRCLPCRFERWYCCDAPACRCIQASVLCHKRSSQFNIAASSAGHSITDFLGGHPAVKMISPPSWCAMPAMAARVSDDVGACGNCWRHEPY
jgi:hypothetical protein